MKKPKLASRMSESRQALNRMRRGPPEELPSITEVLENGLPLCGASPDTAQRAIEREALKTCALQPERICPDCLDVIWHRKPAMFKIRK